MPWTPTDDISQKWSNAEVYDLDRRGTPHGTVVDGLSARHYLGGLTRWLLGGWSH